MEILSAEELEILRSVVNAEQVTEEPPTQPPRRAIRTEPSLTSVVQKFCRSKRPLMKEYFISALHETASAFQELRALESFFRERESEFELEKDNLTIEPVYLGSVSRLKMFLENEEQQSLMEGALYNYALYKVSCLPAKLLVLLDDQMLQDAIAGSSTSRALREYRNLNRVFGIVPKDFLVNSKKISKYWFRTYGHFTWTGEPSLVSEDEVSFDFLDNYLCSNNRQEPTVLNFPFNVSPLSIENTLAPSPDREVSLNTLLATEFTNDLAHEDSVFDVRNIFNE